MGVELDSKDAHARKRDVSQRKRAGTLPRAKAVKRQNFRKTMSQWREELNERDDSDSDSEYNDHQLQNFGCTASKKRVARANFAGRQSSGQQRPSPSSQHQTQLEQPKPERVESRLESIHTPTQCQSLDCELSQIQPLQCESAQLELLQPEPTAEEFTQAEAIDRSLQSMAQLDSIQSEPFSFEAEPDLDSEPPEPWGSTQLYATQFEVEETQPLLQLEAQASSFFELHAEPSLQLEPTQFDAAFDCVQPMQAEAASDCVQPAELESSPLDLAPLKDVLLETSADIKASEVYIVAEVKNSDQSAEATNPANSNSSLQMVASPPGWTSAVLLKVGAWVNGLFSSRKQASGKVARVGPYQVQVLALPCAVEEKRVACKLTAGVAYEDARDNFAMSLIGQEWKFYSHLQKGACPPTTQGDMGCRHDLILRALSAMADVQCCRPDGSEYTTNLLVLEEAAASLEGLLLQGPFRESHALVLFENLLAAVGTLHRHKICHRDLKPCQTLFSKEGHMKLADLDAAAFFRDFQLPNVLDAIVEGSDDVWQLEMLSDGTPGWMAPEIEAWNNWKWGEPRPPYYGIATAADIWGCGQILLCMLLGVDDSGEALAPESRADPRLSERVRQLLDGLLETDPARRFSLSCACQSLAQYWADFGRPSDLEVTAEVVARLRRPAGTKINAVGDEENDGWLVVNGSQHDDSWTLL